MSSSATTTRLDIALVNRGLAGTRSRARALIMAGDVLVNAQPVLQAGAMVESSDEIALRAKPRFVSRGGEKLAHALRVFGVEPGGRVCADLGASTGGFTDCLIQAGARRVYAVDVGYGQIDQRLRDDPRAVVIERTNARYLEGLPEPVSLVTIDVSFISLALIFPAVTRLLDASGEVVTLVKPQFEAGRGEVGKGGVVRNPAIHRKVLESVIEAAASEGLTVVGVTRSPLVGPKGNVEFLAHFRRGGGGNELEVADMIERVMGGQGEKE